MMESILKINTPSRVWPAIECIALFILLPCIFYFHATRWNIHLAIWLTTIYAMYRLEYQYGYTPASLWHGKGWTKQGMHIALLRFLVSIPLVIGLTLYLAPEKLFGFPMQHPVFWLVVMVLYPILSVIPQEILFRCYFFQRAKNYLAEPWPMIIASAASFGFAHVVFHNWVSPLLCLIGGLMFSHSFSQHRSLKWAVVEHAAYGCMVFTIGIGTYFLVNGGR